MPAADLAPDAALVRRLLAEQHPDLAGLPLAPVAEGWDNVVLRLGDDLAVRVPRREAAAHLIMHEQRALPAIAATSPVAVPLPVRVGTPSDAFPWPWSVVPWFPGRPVAALGLRGDLRLAEDLAAFAAALHRPAGADVDSNPVRGGPLTVRADVVEERLRHPGVPDADRLRSAWRTALAAPPWPGPAMRLHGDLHPANLIADGGRLVAVIDFGDTTGGDPATDVATAWLSLDAAARDRFRAVLQPDPDTWLRARGWALRMAAAMVVEPDGGELLRASGLAALREVAADA